MPALIETPLTAVVNFPLPRSKLVDPDQYLVFDISNLIPCEAETIPLNDLRPDLEAGTLGSAKEQLDMRGFAAVKAESTLATEENLGSVEGTDKYLEETCECVAFLAFPLPSFPSDAC